MSELGQTIMSKATTALENRGKAVLKEKQSHPEEFEIAGGTWDAGKKEYTVDQKPGLPGVKTVYKLVENPSVQGAMMVDTQHFYGDKPVALDSNGKGWHEPTQKDNVRSRINKMSSIGFVSTERSGEEMGNKMLETIVHKLHVVRYKLPLGIV